MLVAEAAAAEHSEASFLCSCLLASLHGECPHILFCRALPCRCRSPDVILQPYAAQSNASRHARGSNRLTPAAAKARDRQHARQHILQDFSLSEMNFLPCLQQNQTLRFELDGKCVVGKDIGCSAMHALLGDGALQTSMSCSKILLPSVLS